MRPRAEVPVAFSRAVMVISRLAARVDISCAARPHSRVRLTMRPCAAEENASEGKRQTDASTRKPATAQSSASSRLAPLDDMALTKPAPSARAKLVLAGRAAAGACAPCPLASVVAVATAAAPRYKTVFAVAAPSAKPSLATVLGTRLATTFTRQRSPITAKYQTVDAAAPVRLGTLFAVVVRLSVSCEILVVPPLSPARQPA